MASVTKRPDRDGYVVRWREGGRNRSRSAPDKRTADRLADEIRKAEALGERWTPSSDRGLTSLDEALERFVKHAKRTLKPRTAALYAMHLDLFEQFVHSTEPRRRAWFVDVLSRELLERFWDHLSEPNGRHGRTRAPSTRRKYLETAELCWSWLFDRDDEFVGVPRKRSVVADMRKPRRKAVEAPTWHEMDLCIAEMAGTWQRKALVVMRYTGLRIDQVMRLEWNDIDVGRAVLHVRPELGKSEQEEAGRFVPLSRHLVADLAGWGVRQGWLVPSGREGVRAREFRSRDIARAWRRTGVREAVWRGRPCHSFRKGFESGLLGLDAHLVRVDFLVGHSVSASSAPYIDSTIAHPVEELRSIVDLVPRIDPFPRRSPAEGGALATAAG